MKNEGRGEGNIRSAPHEVLVGGVEGGELSLMSGKIQRASAI